MRARRDSGDTLATIAAAEGLSVSTVHAVLRRLDLERAEAAAAESEAEHRQRRGLSDSRS